MGHLYTCKKNIQILIALLKENGIKRVIASPGTTNLMFIGSIQKDSWFEIYSAADERSAAYMACGMAAESMEPVVISCTGATASRNYIPGLTEAYYRKLPILVVTSLSDRAVPDQLMPQVIDRSIVSKDILNFSITLSEVKDSTDERKCILFANQALIELKKNGGGPVHINLIADFSYNFSISELPQVRKINYITYSDVFPIIKSNKTIGIFVGAHSKWTNIQIQRVEEFCELYNAVVFCDHTSNYVGKYKVLFSLIAGQEQLNRNTIKIDLMIDIGNVSGDYYTIPTDEVWRVSETGKIQDRFGKLFYYFDMKEEEFFHSFIETAKKEGKTRIGNNLYDKLKNKYENVYKQIPEIPFSNIWIAKKLAPLLPTKSVLHIGILNSLRSWNFFNIPDGITSSCNVGGFGIDGGLSTVIGASLIEKNKLFFCILGDLAFFYDMNSLGNRHIGNNLRILLINNGKGTEFCNYSHPGSVFKEEVDWYIAAGGHYGNQSRELVKHYAEDLGFLYLQASNKEEFNKVYEQFFDSTIEKSIIFEVFTDSKDESDALYIIRNIVHDMPLKQKVKKIVGTNNIKIIRDIIKK